MTEKMEHANAVLPAGIPFDGQTIRNVYLEPFERAVYARQYEVAGRMLVALLVHLRYGAEIIGYQTDEQTKTVLYTRLAAGLTTLMSDPKFQLSQEGFDKLATEHPTIDAIFRASAFEASDHLARQFSDFDPASPNRLRFRDSPNLGKFLLTYSLSSRLQLVFEKLFQMDPRVTFPLFAGMIAHLSVLTSAAHARREHLLGLGEIFEKVSVSESTLNVLSDAYMYCSYAVRRDKHAVKRTINRVLRRYMRRVMPEIDTPPQRPLRSRPRVLVGLEWYNSVHAMYRCFHPTLSQLRERFELIGAARLRETDENAMKQFDAFLVVDEDANLVTLAKQIRELAPDIIFYPSIGMSLWWLAMSACRLAPIQIMGVGHPASSFSPEIDYLIAEKGIVADPDLASETLIELPRGSTRFLPRSDMPSIAPMEPSSGAESVQVAVPAMAAKLSEPFLQLLRRVQDRAGRKVVFHFFPNQMGLTQFLLEKEMRRWLRHIRVSGRLGYGEYLSRLRECELHLSPHPFGGTNSNIDSMLLGLPIVALRGEEPHATVDAQMLERIGLTDLAVSTEKEYEDLAVRLLTDDPLRREYALRVRAAPVAEAFFGEGPPEVRGAWLRAFQLIDDHHPKLRRHKTTEVK